MAVRTQPLDLPISGLKQASDVRVAPVDGTQRLENYRVDRAMALRKRAGIAGPAFAAGSPPARATPLPLGGLHVLRGDGTCGATADLGATLAVPFDPFSAPFDTFAERGFAPFGAPEVLAREAFASQGVVTDRSQTHACLTLSFLVVVAYTNAGNDGRALVASVYDRASGALLYAKQDLSPSTFLSEAHFVLLSTGLTDDIVLLSSTSTTVAVERRPVTGAGLGPRSAVVTFAIGGDNLWDACLGNAGEVLVVHGTGAVTARRLSYLTLATLATTPLAGTVTPVALSVSCAGGKAALAYVEQGTNARKAALFDAGTLGSVTVTAIGGAPTQPRSCAACVVNPAAGAGALAAVFLYASANDLTATPVAALDATATFCGALDGAGAAIGDGATWLGCRPSAKPFAPSTTRCCAPLDVVSVRAVGAPGATSANPSSGAEPGFGTVVVEALAELDSGAPRVSTAPVPLAWHNLARSSATQAVSKLHNPALESDGAVTLCYTALDRAQLVTNTPGVGASATTVRAVVVRYRPLPSAWAAASQPPKSYASAGATALLAGGLPALAEGCGAVPAGHLHTPEIVALRRTVTGTSAVWPTASIALRARYVWLDGRGNESVSAW
ncbi:MAG TPA: hypothetical protein VFS43_00275, partial [Polyangiaceae bacterium]|nr:hypothetical protein [Polyangiaceae bacterium]